eukprot:Sspe_Gene.49333::Locus_26476_Transcript_1_1_Confidence_1.000_Length_384::g.49333::m.49333
MPPHAGPLKLSLPANCRSKDSNSSSTLPLSHPCPISLRHQSAWGRLVEGGGGVRLPLLCPPLPIDTGSGEGGRGERYQIPDIGGRKKAQRQKKNEKEERLPPPPPPPP